MRGEIVGKVRAANNDFDVLKASFITKDNSARKERDNFLVLLAHLTPTKHPDLARQIGIVM